MKVSVTRFLAFAGCPVVATIDDQGAQSGAAGRGQILHDSIHDHFKTGKPIDTLLAGYFGPDELETVTPNIMQAIGGLEEGESEVSRIRSFGENELSGRVDRVNLKTSPALIVDFKSSSWGSPDAKQLALYAVLFGVPARVEIRYLDGAPPTAFVVGRETLAAYEEWAMKGLDAFSIYASNLSKPKANHANCGACWFYPVCPERLEMRHLNLQNGEDVEAVASLYFALGKEEKSVAEQRERLKVYLEANAPDGGKTFKMSKRTYKSPMAEALDFVPPEQIRAVVKPDAGLLAEHGFSHLVNQNPYLVPIVRKNGG
jgi:hypothetical protein